MLDVLDVPSYSFSDVVPVDMAFLSRNRILVVDGERIRLVRPGVPGHQPWGLPPPEEEAWRPLRIEVGFALLSLEIRQLYQGPFLNIAGRTTTFAERSTDSIALILYSAALLAIGINRGWRSARYGALVVMLVSVMKVYLIDVGTLGGLYRVGSFLGLGAILLGIAWLYQRFLVGKDGESALPDAVSNEE